jgi:serine/threonine-protein kinase
LNIGQKYDMKIDREQWTRLSALLDAALEIDDQEREAWLQQLPADASALKEPLRTLLAQRANIETGDFLKAPDFAAALRLESARSQSPSLELEAGTEIGAYRLLRELGRGGMGSVWLAERIDGKLKRQVALKFPYAGPNQRQLAERLQRERDILSNLEHPNIARLYDADTTESGQPFLVLEYVNGVLITDYCDRNKLTSRQRLILFMQVLKAVQHAHAHLVIHRDLKPSNILVTDDGVVRLLDFGIAKLTSEGEAKESELTRLGGQALTPDFASPEQILGGSITTATDLYSLGVVLYELLCGAQPYRLRRQSAAALEEAIAAADIAPPSRAAIEVQAAQNRSSTINQLARELRGDLDSIVLKMLKKDTTERYASSDAVLADIASFLDGRSVSVRADSAWYRIRKFVARRKLVVASVALVAVAIVSGGAIALWQARVASREADKSTAINKFLIAIFSGADIGAGTKKPPSQMTAAELLDSGAEKLALAFDEQPEVKAELIRQLGSMYAILDQEDKSIALYRQGIVYVDAKLGPNSPQRAMFLYLIANDQSFAGHWDEASKTVAEAESAFAAAGDDQSEHFASFLKLKGNLLRGQIPDQFAASKAALERAAKLFAERYPTNKDYAATLMFLANLHMSVGDDFAAERAAEGAVKAALQPSVQLVDQASAYAIRCTVRGIAGKYGQAEEDCRTASALYEKSVGVHHFLYLQNESTRGEFLHLLGQRDAGIALMEKTAAEIAAVREGSNTNAFTLRRLAAGYSREGSFARAVETASRSIALFRTLSQPSRLAMTLLDRAEALTALDQLKEARVDAEEAAALYPPPSIGYEPTAARAQLALATIALRSGELDRASELARVADHKTRSEGFGESGRRAQIYVLQSEIALAKSEFASALAHVERALQLVKSANLGADPTLMARLQVQHGTVLCRIDKKPEGREALRRGIESFHSIHEAASPLPANAERQLANCV